MTRSWMLAGVLLLSTAGGQASQPPDAQALFSPPVAVNGTLSPDAGQGRGVRSRVARVSADRLEDDRLLLNLFPDLSLSAGRLHAEVLPDGSRIWSGQVDGEPLSAVTIVRADAIIQGSVSTASGAFSIEPIANGPDHLIRQIDPAGVPVELPPLVPPQAPATFDIAEGIQSDDGGTIDLLAVYTTAARSEAGSDSAIRARIALGVAETNTAYARSGVVQRIRLVGTELVGYHESGDLGQDLQRITTESDGLMDGVHARRTAIGADLVKLIVGSTAGGACGVAWVMQSQSVAFAPFAFSVTAYPCISPNYTFGHEIGHNMGAAHAPEDPNAPPVAPFAYGFKDPAGSFRTVMAYDCPQGCPRVLHFSNPGVSYSGKPTGTTSQHNNALALNQTGPTVASFRPTRSAPPLGPPADFRIETAGTTATLSWHPPASGAPTGYVIEVGTEEGYVDVGTLVVGGESHSFTQPAVPPGSYAVRVRALDAFGPGEPSDSVRLVMTATGRCVAEAGAPGLLPPVVTGAQVTLTWSAPATGAPVDQYYLRAGTRPLSADAAAFSTGSVATTLTTTAAPGVYFVRVSGINPCGIGTPSNEVSVVVGPPVPGPPTGLMTAIGADRTVTLTWQPSAAGGAATGFVVEAGNLPGLSNLAVLATPSATPAFSVVAPPGRYYVRVRAVNDAGASVPSEEIVLQVL